MKAVGVKSNPSPSDTQRRQNKALCLIVLDNITIKLAK